MKTLFIIDEEVDCEGGKNGHGQDLEKHFEKLIYVTNGGLKG